jgi:hypothetical protein
VSAGPDPYCSDNTDVSSFRTTGVNATATTSEVTQPVNINRQADSTADDPFAAQRTADNNPFAEKSDGVAELGSSPPVQSGSPKQDRRLSKEWGRQSYRNFS